jgi:hypothetical protein
MEETTMNEWDRDNLDFILNTSEAEFAKWMLQADADDINYALELIDTHRMELNMKQSLLREPGEDIDITQAKQVLEKYRL